jgi:arabinan endo-1,5-alpha-L-arabinosidase
LVLLLVLPAGAARAQSIRDGASLLSCPDPSVVSAHVGRYHYYLVCTSDFNPDALPIWGSNDLTRWQRIGFVFPTGAQPWWALASPTGRYWAPALYRIQNRWVVYFAAEYNSAALTLRYANHSLHPPGDMVIGVATASSLGGPWHSELLHYRGEFNGVSREHENYGGVIDPSVVRDGQTGQLYLFWAEQHSSIWASKLSPNGLTLDPQIHMVLWTEQGWECRTPHHTCVVEGPEEYYRDGWFYLFYSGASTWTGTYAVGVAVSQTPMQSQFKALTSGPTLASSRRWVGPGGTSAPVVGPDGRTYLFYHAETGPNDSAISADRFLFASPITWEGLGGYYPMIGSGEAG